MYKPIRTIQRALTISFLLLLVFNVRSIAQLADIRSPRIISPAPEAAALGKYAQIPVDKNSGIPQIAIPLYEIKTPRFNIPISLSYHASGIKVDESATWVGIGWSLNAGGVITRSIINRPDDNAGFLYTTVKNSAQIRASNDTNYLKEAAHLTPDYDTQPDNFFYNFLDKSGAFVFGQDKLPVLTPYKPLKITFNLTSSPKTFTVLDESGNTYLFNDTESSASSSSNTMAGISSWYLSQMISTDHSDTVKFIYQTDPQYYNQYSYSFTQNYGSVVDANGCGGTSLWGLTASTNITTVSNPLYIKTILFKGGKVDFVAKSGRLDGMHLSLDSVIISGYNYNLKNYTRLKSFKLNTGYFYNNLSAPLGSPYGAGGSKYRLKLDSLVESDQNNINVKTHKFDYDPVILPPVNFFAQDYWGYYNGKFGNHTLLPAKQYTGVGNTVYTVGGTDGGDRSPDPNYMKAGMLEKITYPTKGYTVFNYETHKYLDYSQTLTHQQTSMAASVGYYSEINTTPFTSGANADGSGTTAILTVLLKHTSGFPGQLPATPYVLLTKVSNGAVLYSQYANTSSDINTTVTIPLEPNTQYQLYALAKGGNMTMSTDLLPTANISINYMVTQTQPPAVVNGGGLRISSILDYNSDGSLAKAETYKYGANQSGVGELMGGNLAFINSFTRTFWNRYTDDPTAHTTGTCSGNEIIYSSSSVYPLSSLSGSPVSYAEITVYQGDSLVNAGKSTYNYSNYADSIQQVDTGYPYTLMNLDNSYQNGIKLIPVTWKNGQIIHEAHYRNNGNNQYALVQEKFNDYYYFSRTAALGVFIGNKFDARGFDPYDWPYQPIGNFVFFDYPISSGSTAIKQGITIDYAADGATKLQQDTVNYFYDNLSHVQPTRIIHKGSLGEALQTQISYPPDMANAGADPSGIYATMTAANIIRPSIEITNLKNGSQLMKSRTNYFLTNSMVEPQSVELQTLGNPSEVRLNYQNYDTKGDLLTVLKPAGAPVSYLWGYNNHYPVAEINNASYQTIVNVLGQSVIDQLNSSPGSDAQIRNQLAVLRTALPAAQVTIYTYAPSIGMTSATDARGMTTYYEYDSFQRLMNIRDKDGNIVKHIDYHYQGQTN